jgi:hypothetical protein
VDSLAVDGKLMPTIAGRGKTKFMEIMAAHDVTIFCSDYCPTTGFLGSSKKPDVIYITGSTTETVQHVKNLLKKACDAAPKLLHKRSIPISLKKLQFMLHERREKVNQILYRNGNLSQLI